MSKLHYIQPTGVSRDALVVRLGAGTGSANNLSGNDAGKLVKFVGESRYDLCVAGDLINAAIVSVEPASSGGFSIGGIDDGDRIKCTADGLQATPGTGSIAVGDYVVAGSITAKGTALAIYPKVCKATVQIGAVPASLTEAGLQAAMAAAGAWRVVSVENESGTAAVGATVVIAPAAKKA